MANRLLNIFIISLLGLFTILSANSCKKQEVNNFNEVGVKVGYLAPAFNVPDKNDNVVSLDDYEGKIILVEFWASWCSYCLAEIPVLNQIHEDFQSYNFALIGISLDTNPADWIKKIQDKNIDYLQLNDPQGFSSEVAKAYEVSSIPKMILINEEGYILMITTNANDVREFLNTQFN